MFSDLPTFDASEQLTTPILVPMSPPPLGTIHILRKHIFQLFGPPPYISMFSVLKINNFGIPPPPLQKIT